MIPYPYNMVDMGGIDLAEANGTVVEGLYAKIVEAVNACGDVVLYNWKFAGIEIAPQHTSILLGDPIIINGAVQVTEQDKVTVPGLNLPPIIEPLTVHENGEYSASDFQADGFDPVNVLIPHPVIIPLEVDQNGVYVAPSGVAGYSPITVNVGASATTEIWDFRESNIVGSINKIAPYQYSANVLTQNGLLLGGNAYVRMPFKFASAIFEFDIAASQAQSSTGRFFMADTAGSGTTPSDGFGWSSIGKWGFYRSAWSYTDITDPAILSNSVISIEVDNSGTMFVKKNGDLLCKSPDGLFSSRIDYYVTLGSSNGSLPALITGLRILRKGE